MIRIKYIIRSGALVLRISGGKERFYKNMNHLLTGNPSFKYWEASKERFSYRCQFYAENNDILEKTKNVYRKLTIEYPELTARQIASFYKTGNGLQKAISSDMVSGHKPYINSIEEYLKVVIEREKSKPGYNFMFYRKFLQRAPL